MNAYSELYLHDAMTNLGEMTEYAVLACGMDMNEFFACFRISGYATSWEDGDPKYIAGMSGTELCRRVLEATEQYEGDYPPALVFYDTGMEYWCGWILAYMQWRLNVPFSVILEAADCDELARIYPAMHTASEERCVAYILERMRENIQTTRLQRYRQALGMTQKELSERSDVNLRTIQQYEAGSKDISKASYANVMRLAQSLNRRPEELIIY